MKLRTSPLTGALARHLVYLVGVIGCTQQPPPVQIVGEQRERAFYPADESRRAMLGTRLGQPLWHDDQRLRSPCASADSCDPVLGPRAMLYALPVLDSLAEPAHFVTERHVAFADVRGVPPAGMNPPLKPGYNDIYLRYTGGANGTWEGRLAPAGGPSVPLRVYRFDYDTIRTPAAAQWDWDVIGHRQLFGVQCGRTGWCVLGTTAPVAPAPPPECPEGVIKANAQCGPCPDAGGRPVGGDSRRCAIKGWYDDQRLSLPIQGGVVRLSPARGVIVPVRGLEDINEPEQLVTAPVAAIAWVDNDYDAKALEYRSGKLLKLRTKLENPEATDRAQWHFSGRAERHREDGAADRFILIRWLGAPRIDFEWERPPHHLPGASVPGSARWKWRDEDEGIWVRCGGGCCQDKL